MRHLIQLEKIKFFVLKWDDIDESLTKNEFKRFDQLVKKVEDCREDKGKSRMNEYLVINTDENYAEDVVDILKKNNHWC